MRLRAQHRGRGGAAAAGPRPLPAARDDGARVHPAPGGAVRRRHAVPAAAGGRAAAGRGARRPRRRRGGPDPDRLAGRPHRQQPPRGHRAAGRAGHPAGVHRARPHPGGRPRRAAPVRAEALRHPPAHRERGRGPRPRRPRRVLRGQPVVADHRLQGHADRRPGHDHVPRPGRPRPRVGDRTGALALQHQHVPVVAAVAPLPLHRPQRRDQHPARQHQLDAGARGAVRIGPDGGRPAEALPHHQGEPERHRHLRQRARVPGHDRPVAAPRGADDDPGAVAEARVDGGRPAGVLRVPLGPDGAVGRPRVDRVHRRHGGRGGPRPQRAAPVPLLRDEGRPGGDGVRSRRPRRTGGERAGQGTAAPGPDLPRRHRAGAHHRRRGDQVGARGRASLPGLARRRGRAPRRPAARPGGGAGRPGIAAAAPAGVRVHRGGPADTARSHGRAGGRARRVDGHRHRAGGAVRPAAAALRLLQAALRAGHQPAPRRHPGGAGHRHELDPGGRAEPAEAGARVLSSDPHRVPDSRQRGDGAHPAQPRPVPAGGDAIHPVRPPRGRRCHRQGDGRAVPAGQRRRRRRLRAARALGPRRRRGPRADPPPSSSPPACTTTSCARAPAPAAPSSSSRASPASRTTCRCCSATARGRSTRTWRSRPSRS